jgi:uncharacterized membrane protein YccC
VARLSRITVPDLPHHITQRGNRRQAVFLEDGNYALSRAGYYRHFQASAPARADADLRDAIQKLCLKHRHYGYRRVTAALVRRDTVVNSKRVQRLMREDNLLAQRFRPFVPELR